MAGGHVEMHQGVGSKSSLLIGLLHRQVVGRLTGWLDPLPFLLFPPLLEVAFTLCRPCPQCWQRCWNMGAQGGRRPHPELHCLCTRRPAWRHDYLAEKSVQARGC